MHLVRVTGGHARIGILKDLQYRVNFADQLVNSPLGFLLAIGSILVVFRHTDLLGDWTRTDLIMLIGMFSIVRGFINLFVRPGLQAYMEGIRTGLFDYVLLKPLDLQFYVSIRECCIWSLVGLLTGVGLVAWRGWVGGLDASIFSIVLFFVAMLAGFSVVLAFWFIKVDNIFVVFDSLFQTARWPLTAYPGARAYSSHLRGACSLGCDHAGCDLGRQARSQLSVVDASGSHFLRCRTPHLLENRGSTLLRSFGVSWFGPAIRPFPLLIPNGLNRPGNTGRTGQGRRASCQLSLADPVR